LLQLSEDLEVIFNVLEGLNICFNNWKEVAHQECGYTNFSLHISFIQSLVFHLQISLPCYSALIYIFPFYIVIIMSRYCESYNKYSPLRLLLWEMSCLHYDRPLCHTNTYRLCEEVPALPLLLVLILITLTLLFILTFIYEPVRSIKNIVTEFWSLFLVC
jgi:hypothetical protein